MAAFFRRMNRYLGLSAPGIRSALLLCLCLCFCQCAGMRKPDKDASKDANSVSGYGFPFPEIPRKIQKPEERLAYLALHYWENFDFGDTAFLLKAEIAEQGFADFAALLPSCPPPVKAEALANFCQKAGKKLVSARYFHTLTEKYWYDPNSPFRDEANFRTFLQHFLQNPIVPEVEKFRPRHLEALLGRNCPGDTATDFRFHFSARKTARLHEIQAEYLILYFNNPGCQTCATSRAELLCAPTINTRIQQGRLKILSVYPDGIPDSGILPTQEIPGWMEVYDANRNVLEKDLYDLKAIPTLYLLDKDKKVLLKDVPVRQIEGYLESDTSSTSDS